MDKDGFKPLLRLKPDIICCQEVKTQQRPQMLPGYYHYWETGQREGYAEVLTMVKKEPVRVFSGLGNTSLDREGGIITLEYETFLLSTLIILILRTVLFVRTIGRDGIRRCFLLFRI